MTENHAKKPVLKIAPATIVDLADMAEHVRASRAQWGIIREATRTGSAWSLRQGDELLGVAGLVPIGPGQAEAWFHFRPAAAGSMRAIVRAIRLTMDASPYRAIVTLCTSKAGSRIARAAGFAFAEPSDFGEVWAYGRASGRVFRWQSAAGAEGPDGEPAADVAGGAG